MSELDAEIDRAVHDRAALEFERQVAAGLSGTDRSGPVPATKLCGADVEALRPFWMSADQYDLCRCIRPAGHDPELAHACEHTIGGQPS